MSSAEKPEGGHFTFPGCGSGPTSVLICYGSVLEVGLTVFVSVAGPKTGLAVSSATRWIRQVVLQAYALKGRAPPFRVTVHSTRAISASWAFRHQASVLQVCKAATWSSVHTFSKFYKVDVSASSDASFGRRVLQAAVFKVGVPPLSNSGFVGV